MRCGPSPLPGVKLGPQVFEWALYSDFIGVDGTSITVRTEAACTIGGFLERIGPKIANSSFAWRRTEPHA